MKRTSAFTLLELLAVLVILVALIAILATTIRARVTNARIQQTQLLIGNLTQGLEGYHLDKGTYPTTEQGLQALIYIPSNEMTARPMMPGTIPGTMPGAMPGADPFAPGATNMGATSTGTSALDGPGFGAPGATDPFASPGAAPGTDPFAAPGTMPGSTDPFAAPGTMPGAMPGSTDPYGAPGGMPGASSLGTGGSLTGGNETTYNPQLYAQLRKRPSPYLETNDDEVPVDLWKRPFRYVYAPVNGINPLTGNDRPAVWSAGPDGIDNTDDDVRSWDPAKVVQQMQQGYGQGGVDPVTGQPTTVPGQPTPVPGQPDPYGMQPQPDPFGGQPQPGPGTQPTPFDMPQPGPGTTPMPTPQPMPMPEPTPTPAPPTGP